MQKVFKARPSQWGALMTEPKEKQPHLVYSDSIMELERLSKLQSDAKNKETKVYIDRSVKIENIKKEISELEPIKDKVMLSEGAKSYIQEWVKEKIYGVKNDISSKYLTKGNEVEDQSIDIYALYKDLLFVAKNEKTFSNEYLVGTPDLILPDKIVDIKSSWDCFTFPLFDTSISNNMYYWQLQGYMALTGKHKAELVYVLINTPEHLQYTELDATDYSRLDLKYRVKVFEVERNDSDIQKGYKRIEACREYIKELMNGY